MKQENLQAVSKTAKDAANKEASARANLPVVSKLVKSVTEEKKVAIVAVEKACIIVIISNRTFYFSC